MDLKENKRMGSGVRLSDMERMGAGFVQTTLVQQTFLRRKYRGDLLFAGKRYHVYVSYGFYSGARICGIALEQYRTKEEAELACIRFNEAYQGALVAKRKSLKKIRRQRILGDIAVHVIAVFVICMYIQRFFLVAEWGLDPASFILSIIYPVIVALCYIIHFRLQ